MTDFEKIKQDVKCTVFLEPSKNRMFCCPHPDCQSGHGPNKTGAVKYYEDTNTWYCHACSRGGDVIDLYRLINGATFEEAVSVLSDSKPTGTRKTASKTREKAEVSQQHQNNIKTSETVDFTDYYRQCEQRLTDPAAMAYLKARGISPEIASLFSIGYDPEADPAAAPGAISDAGKKHPEPRIIIPCTKDFYMARAVNPDEKKRFINPSGTEKKIFNANCIYNTRDNNIVFVVEGVFDALAIIESGFQALAINTRVNGGPLIPILKDRPAPRTRFIICPDNDRDPKTAEKTMKEADALNNDLHILGYKSIVFNAAGSHKDTNDALLADKDKLKIALSVAEMEIKKNECDHFLEVILSRQYEPHPTGLYFFDDLLEGGIINQTLMQITAPPAAGKTVLAQQVAEAIAGQAQPVIYFNFEMSKEQMLARALSAHLFARGKNYTALEILQAYKLNDKSKFELQSALNQYAKDKSEWIKYNPNDISNDIDDVLSYLNHKAEAARSEGRPAPAAVIDYLHIMTSKDKLEIQELIKRIVKGLKDYAIRYNTFVIAITAANRETAKSKQTSMMSGRDSSNLEFSADYLIGIDIPSEEGEGGTRKKSDSKQKQPVNMQLKLHKNRYGISGRYTDVLFYGAYNTFTKDYKDSAANSRVESKAGKKHSAFSKKIRF